MTIGPRAARHGAHPALPRGSSREAASNQAARTSAIRESAVIARGSSQAKKGRASERAAREQGHAARAAPSAVSQPRERASRAAIAGSVVKPRAKGTASPAAAPRSAAVPMTAQRALWRWSGLARARIHSASPTASRPRMLPARPPRNATSYARAVAVPLGTLQAKGSMASTAIHPVAARPSKSQAIGLRASRRAAHPAHETSRNWAITARTVGSGGSVSPREPSPHRRLPPGSGPAGSSRAGFSVSWLSRGLPTLSLGAPLPRPHPAPRSLGSGRWERRGAAGVCARLRTETGTDRAIWETIGWNDDSERDWALSWDPRIPKGKLRRLARRHALRSPRSAPTLTSRGVISTRMHSGISRRASGLTAFSSRSSFERLGITTS